MPKITVYEAPDNIGIRPNETGTAARLSAARVASSNYAEAAAAETAEGRFIGSGIEAAGQAVVKYLDHQQISQGSAAYASIINAKQKQWDEIVKRADPNDPTVAARFIEENLKPDLDKFKTGFLTENGQRWAESHANQFLTHMQKSTSADMSTMAGQAIAINMRQTVNQLSNAVRSDPSSLDFSLSALEGTVNGMVATSPTLSGTQVGKVRTEALQRGKEEIVQSYLVGLAAINPDAATKAVESGKYSAFISGDQAKAIVANARAQVRAERTDAAYRRHLEDQQRKDVSEAAENDIVKDIYGGDLRARAGVSAKSIVNDDRLTVQTKEKLLRVLEHESTRKEAVLQSDPGTREQLAVGLFDRTNPTTLEDVIRAHSERKLSDGDFVKLRQNVMDLKKDPLAGPATQAAIHAAKDQLTYQMPGLPGKDPKGSQAYADFMNEFVARYLALPQDERPKATNFSDKSSLINQMVQKYDRTPSQKLKDRIDELSTLSPAAPSTPGPTAFVPPPAWEWSASRRQYRDPATGTIYDAAGKRVLK